MYTYFYRNYLLTQGYLVAFLASMVLPWLPGSSQAQLVKNVQEHPLEKGQATHSSILGLSGESADKESACNAGYLGSIPELGRSPGEENGYTLQYSGLENSMDGTVHGVAKSQT